MPHFDALWLASGYEGLPNVIMEAMAAAVPVVATDIPGNRDLVIHGETGFLVPVGDRAEIARKTQRLLDDVDLALRLGAAGKARVLSQFGLEAMVDQYASLYRELLG
jgi:glycosyltransferase involved in cell wall biosynthesis